MKARRKKAVRRGKSQAAKRDIRINSITSEKSVKGKPGDWLEVADGVKMRIQPLDEYRRENPEVNYFLPVDGQTKLNGTILSFEQLAVLRKYFGENVTLARVKLWLEKRNLKIERLAWWDVLELIAELQVEAATPKPVQAKTSVVGGKVSKLQQALALLIEHPDWTNEQIAETLSVHPKSLSRWPLFKAARRVQQGDKRDMPRGSKNGKLEAWQE